MALLTQKAIMTTFEEMLSEMPFDKMTVSALVKRCGISSNTFYYHYQDIYALLDTWLSTKLGAIVEDSSAESESTWVRDVKRVLLACQQHPKIIYNIFNSLSREQLERYVFMNSNDSFTNEVRRCADGYTISETQIEEIAEFCRFAFIGYFIKFIWDKMEIDVEASIERSRILFEQFVHSAIEVYDLA